MNRDQWNRLASEFEEEVCDITANDRNHVLQRLVAQVPRTSRSVLVDLGCGIGNFIQQFGSLFRHVVGVDYSPRMLGRARDRCSSLRQVRWLCTNIRRAPRAIGHRADLTVCLNVITSPSASCRKALWASVRAVTKPGGFALVVVPSIESASMIAGLDDNERKARGRAATIGGALVACGSDLQKYYCGREVRELIASHGLIVHSFRRVFYPWSQEGLPVPRACPSRYPWDWACLARRPSRGLTF